MAAMFIHRQRMEPRTMIAVKASMQVGTRVLDATLANASSRGVLAMVADPPERGTVVDLTIGDHMLRGQVRWRAQDRCGIMLREAVDVAALAQGRAVPLVQVPQRLARRSAMEVLRSLLD